ncbi:sialate O-acetylesterase [Bradyrhizobium sp. CB3481]|uniref:sialate O-acetylesterase n=1 Tax=Bradyrhizobium sp. CB3481 TaxID=3039158 RepID=UPI0024B15C2C|nr:sialate O-acetylesterase [Bradyrhizobium sp. CB3481]WFU16120.1 sialate O-acetylesterase [Bradyrhizobium sp. CB3481]
MGSLKSFPALWRTRRWPRLAIFLAGGLLIGIIIGAFMKWRASGSDWATIPPPPRVERPCSPVSGKTAIIVVHGQSNAANWGSARYTAREAVDNFDPATGRCFAAADPLLGTDGMGGSFATHLGDMLIQSGRYDRVILMPIAKGGASLSYLNDEGAELTTNGIAKLKAAGLTPTHILFQQGERDALMTTSAEQYAALLHQLVKRFRAVGFDAPFYVSRSAKCDYAGPTNIAAVRAGQLAAVDAALNIRQGPDTDTIGNEGRSSDGCHMNGIGTLANAALWAAFIK